MYSIAHPEMFKDNRTILVKDSKATTNNIHLLLSSWKKSLFGDPYFGTNLKRFIYEQNNIILRDLIIDELYSSLIEFIPQVELTRKDIKVSCNDTEVCATISCINKIDREVNTYKIKLISETI